MTSSANRQLDTPSHASLSRHCGSRSRPPLQFCSVTLTFRQTKLKLSFIS